MLTDNDIAKHETILRKIAEARYDPIAHMTPDVGLVKHEQSFIRTYNRVHPLHIKKIWYRPPYQNCRSPGAGAIDCLIADFSDGFNLIDVTQIGAVNPKWKMADFDKLDHYKYGGIIVEPSTLYYALGLIEDAKITDFLFYYSDKLLKEARFIEATTVRHLLCERIAQRVCGKISVPSIHWTKSW